MVAKLFGKALRKKLDRRLSKYSTRKNADFCGFLKEFARELHE